MEIDILIDEEFEGRLESDWLRKRAEQVLAAEGIGAEAELGLVIAGQERVQQLNRDYLGEDRPTDVLAFAMLPEKSPDEGLEESLFVTPPDGLRHLGEVLISYPQAELQAQEHGHAIEREIVLLTIHGILHLLGYDHAEPEQERIMRAREADILSRIELTRD